MKIEDIRIKNFRSIGEEINIKCNSTLNFVIGKNNVGKSNIFIALAHLKQVLQGGTYANIFGVGDWYCRKIEEEMIIELGFSLNEEEEKDLLNLIAPQSITESQREELMKLLKEEGQQKVQIILKRRKGQNPLPNFRVGFLVFNMENQAIPYSEFLSNPYFFARGSFPQGDWTPLVKQYFDRPDGPSDGDSIEEMMLQRYERNKYEVFNFPQGDIVGFLIELFTTKLKLFEDIRQKPVGEDMPATDSLSGRETADVLITLKDNKLRSERDKYTLIQEKFNALFPNYRIFHQQERILVLLL